MGEKRRLARAAGPGLGLRGLQAALQLGRRAMRARLVIPCQDGAGAVGLDAGLLGQPGSVPGEAGGLSGLAGCGQLPLSDPPTERIVVVAPDRAAWFGKPGEPVVGVLPVGPFAHLAG